LVREPRIFLMDEPLSNLDAKLREALRVELKHLQREKRSTLLFVTHDQIEAMTMADRIGVLREGVLAQVGSPREIYDSPATTFVAKLVGAPRINLFNAEASDGKIRIADSELCLNWQSSANGRSAFTLGFRPEDVKFDLNGELSGEVMLLEPLGVETIVHIRNGKQILLGTISGISDMRIGSSARFNIARERLHFFDNTEGRRMGGEAFRVGAEASAGL
jgi:ABC-type sugar transport system ATPase subunit